MRGGTSKGAYFLARDLPGDAAARDAQLLSIMGSPDPRQIDGIGGADPLTSKVAIVEPSSRPGVDVDYLFAQVFVEETRVGYGQNCGNILAGVGYFAIEQGLVRPQDPITPVTIFMVNSGQIAVAEIATPGGQVSYEGGARIDGVPGSAAPVPLSFTDAAGSMCGALLPSGNVVDEVAGCRVTLIDNGMPVVVVLASDMGIRGNETREALEANATLRARLEEIRLAAGPLMNLGDVRDKTVPKMTMVSPPSRGGCVSTRTFIPHRCHATIGVFGAISVATACLLPHSPAAGVAAIPDGASKKLSVEHPAGALDVLMEVDDSANPPEIKRAAFLRTARKLFEGTVFGRGD
ncbi:MAG: 4-oxalomesaconate tautomerase [Kiloniellaceae bacterium]|nr:4-oxalomesaconate tautomerase [Kiloniellaceae bacterium]